MSVLGRVSAQADRRNRERILELAVPAPDGRLLDLGCNDGAFTRVLAEHVGATNIDGVEFVAELAELAAQRGISVVSNDLNLPFATRTGASMSFIRIR